MGDKAIWVRVIRPRPLSATSSLRARTLQAPACSDAAGTCVRYSVMQTQCPALHGVKTIVEYGTPSCWCCHAVYAAEP